MHPELQALIHLQSIDDQITRLQKELDKIPSLIEAENVYLRDFEGSLEDAESDLEAMQKCQREAEGEIQMNEEKLREIRGKQTLVKTNEEYRALTHEIETFQAKIERLEERVIECLEELEPLRQMVVEAQKLLEEAKNKVKISIENHEKTRVRLDHELEKFQRERKDAWAGISTEWQNRYKTLRKGRGGTAVVPIIDRTCQGCRMSETIQRYFEIRDSKEEIFSCSNCGRIMYFKEAEAGIPVSPADDSD